MSLSQSQSRGTNIRASADSSAVDVGSSLVAVADAPCDASGYLSLSIGEIVILQYKGCEASGDKGWLYGYSISTGKQGWFSDAAVSEHPLACADTDLVGSEVEASGNVLSVGAGYLELTNGEVIKVEYAGKKSTQDDGWLFGCSEATGKRGWFSTAAVVPKPKVPSQIAAPEAPASPVDTAPISKNGPLLAAGTVATPARALSGSSSLGRAAAIAEQVGVKLVGVQAVQNLPWQYPLCDAERHCFVGYLPGAIEQRQVKALYRLVQNGMEEIGWETPVRVMKGKVWATNSRQTKWFVAPGCKCQYTYGGPGYGDGTCQPKTAKPVEFPSWMQQVMETVMPLCGLNDPKAWPNCCSMNRYSHNSDAECCWHADDEDLFKGTVQNCCIISLSLGSKRNFEFRRVGETSAAYKIELNGGDLCTMEGMTQKYYQHAVHRQKEGRMNLTWRWIVAHESHRCCTR